MKVWTIKVEDTGETIRVACGKAFIIEPYVPPGGQSFRCTRDEAICNAWAWMVDQFEKEEFSGEG